MLQAAEFAGLEGVVAKRLASLYQPGRRSDSWIKTPLIKTQECLVIGCKPGEGRRAGTIGSVLLAVFDQADQLTYAGHVGTGFTDKALRELHEQLRPLACQSAPVPDVPREYARHAHWVEPVLVADIAFRNWTPENRLRHPVWRGLRSDKPSTSVHRVPDPIPAPSQSEVEGAYRTLDGRWRVEAVRRGNDQFFRLVHAGNVLDGLDIAAVEQLLAQAGRQHGRPCRDRPGRAAGRPAGRRVAPHHLAGHEVRLSR